MPRETITIDTDAPPFEAISKLLSIVAYPDSEDANERYRFAAAAIRFAIYLEAASDLEWALSPQAIRPQVFEQGDAEFQSTFKRGLKLATHRMVLAHTILHPRLDGPVGAPM